MADYKTLGEHGQDATVAWQRRHFARAARLVVGSAAAIALLVACSYTTMQSQAHPGSNEGERLDGDIELAHALARDGLVPVEEAGGMDLVAADGGRPRFLVLPLGMNHGGKRLPKTSQPPPPPPGPCSGVFQPEDCAHGALQITKITPNRCATKGGCVIVFDGDNIVAGDTLSGHKADQEISVSLRTQEGVVVSTCTLINWQSKTRFECTLNPGSGAGLVWNVSIPNHDYKDENAGTGWTWAGLTFSYDGPTINNIIPAVMDVKEWALIVLQGTNFGESVRNVNLTVGGKPLLEIQLVDDTTLRALVPPVQDPGLLQVDVTVSGQAVEATIPVKDIPESPTFPFTTANTFGTEEWNITVAALVVRSGLSEEWFNSHREIILAGDDVKTGGADDLGAIMAKTHLDKWEAVAVAESRDYLTEHFNADNGHGVANEDGVYVSNMGNKLNGDAQHDKEVLTKQLQVLEASTEVPLHVLATIVGNVVKKEPPCAGYPSCQPADAVGHRGWTWHWSFDEKRDSWVWKYGEISDGTQPPQSCGYCDPVKVHAVHDQEYAKERAETCMYCVVDKFKNLDSCKCQDFTLMCLQAHNSVMPEAPVAKSTSHTLQKLLSMSPLHLVHEMLKGEKRIAQASPPAAIAAAATKAPAAMISTMDSQPLAASSPMVDPPWKETQCPIRSAEKQCQEMGGLPSADGLACCSASCGACGGPNCSALAGGESSCCQGAITKKGQLCGSPPCLMALSEFEDAAQQDARRKTCASFGGFWANTSLQCCAATCGMCGGERCESAPGGESKCCLDQKEGARVCSDSHHAPCTLAAGGGPGTLPNALTSGSAVTLPDAPTLGPAVLSVSDQCRQLGGIPDLFGQACCPASCGKCGGIYCELRPGGNACCVDDVIAASVSAFLHSSSCSLCSLRTSSDPQIFCNFPRSDTMPEKNSQVQCGSPPCVVAPLGDTIKNNNSEACRAAGGVPDLTGSRCCPGSW
jgi:hypothetical protein